MTIIVCGLPWSWFVVLASDSRIAGAEDFFSNTPRLPRLGMVVALAFHGQMDIVDRQRALAASATSAFPWPGLCPGLPRGLKSGPSWAVLGGGKAVALRSPYEAMRPCAAGKRRVSPEEERQ